MACNDASMHSHLSRARNQITQSHFRNACVCVRASIQRGRHMHTLMRLANGAWATAITPIVLEHYNVRHYCDSVYSRPCDAMRCEQSNEILYFYKKKNARHGNECSKMTAQRNSEAGKRDGAKMIIHKLHVVDALLCMPSWFIRP